ncbi:HTH_XRE domain containing protein [uncultured Caudovirales phage]|uniref:HTH_XRE domain containing protein n=1 Tax=uncultured Caudovirales phage TaxID=2100421 RepID=A0A6J5PCC7_9CAUD|nr:HTH_XRE domain containing protein [uncultured Caudovirales phage]CAB4173126.1 HTH_XRE domain containing protein [uncultured Caudovirales phage]CAB4179629.1 HTH_XRE domain containing protein [uncultured Caudovirales phage]CAB4204325.1 HTH_XRE domain containing protein [uncultured Caudovirales phage]CAB4216069.1 HTH_XRE domain containing protein [uncultured Caudovirales phage]
MDTLRGRDLRQERLKADLTQEQLAAELKIHKSLVSATETEKTGELQDPAFAERWIQACQRLAGAAA